MSAAHPTVLAEATDLAKRWADGAGLQPFSFTLASGELVVVRGRSGSGKSTLLALLAGWITPDGGRLARVGPWAAPGVERTWKGTAILPQVIGTIAELTSIENVSLPLRLSGSSRHTAETRAREILGQLDLIRRGRPGGVRHLARPATADRAGSCGRHRPDRAAGRRADQPSGRRPHLHRSSGSCERWSTAEPASWLPATITPSPTWPIGSSTSTAEVPTSARHGDQDHPSGNHHQADKDLDHPIAPCRCLAVSPRVHLPRPTDLHVPRRRRSWDAASRGHQSEPEQHQQHPDGDHATGDLQQILQTRRRLDSLGARDEDPIVAEHVGDDAEALRAGRVEA